MNNTHFNLHLKGFVGGADFDRNYVDFVLAKSNGEPVSVLIDSLGGSLATALSIASAFRNHGDVSVHFVGMNASAATIASLGAKHISIDANAMYLVHKCSTEFFRWCDLNADNTQDLINELEAQKSDLDKLDANIASMYSAKCRREKNELLDLMKVGGWLSAQEALDWGFVDEITNSNEQAPVLTDALASAMANAGMPIPNIPVQDRNSPFAKFLASLSSLFKSEKQSQNSNTMNITFKNIGKILNVEELNAEDNKVSLSVESLNAIEATLDKQAKEIASLNERISALASAPADSSTAVIEDNKPQMTEKSDVEQFFDTINSARKLYDIV
ncbi:MAG: Clp protease ClpP [Muribaculaceae bacterium]|nr:Clp protease ClpP [Muribaculaceae bacterium]